MMKTKKVIIAILLTIVFILLGHNISNGAYSADSKAVNSGENFNVTVSSTSAMDSYNLSLSSYTGLTFNGCSKKQEGAVIAIDGGNIGYMNLSGNTTTLGTYSFKAPVVTSDTTYTIIFAEAVGGDTNIKSTITVKAPAPVVDTNTPAPSTPAPATKSNNTNLKNLGIKPNDFKGFTASNKKYSVTVSNEVSSVYIYATKAEDSQTISGDGNRNKTLEVGDNNCIVTVTAENGETDTYYIVIKRKVEKTETVPNVVEEPEELLKLATLEVKNATITPEFNPDVYEYEINLTDTSIEKLDILATANIEKATIEVTGNENFMEGDNTVSIVLKSEDGTKAATYKIVVKKGAATEGIVEENNAENTEQPKEEKKNPLSFINGQNKGMIIILSIAIVVLLASIATVIVIIVKNRKEAKAEIMSFTPSSEYSVFKEKKETDKNKDEKIENIEEEPKKKKGRHF